MALIDDSGRRVAVAPPRRRSAPVQGPTLAEARRATKEYSKRERQAPAPAQSPATASAPARTRTPPVTPTSTRSSAAEDFVLRPGFNSQSPLPSAPVQGPTQAETEWATREYSEKPPPPGPLDVLGKTSEVQRQYLTKSGYGLPQGPMARPKSPYDMENSKRQTAYTYRLSDLEKNIADDLAREIGWTKVEKLSVPHPLGAGSLDLGQRPGTGYAGPGGMWGPLNSDTEEKAAQETEDEESEVNPEEVTVEARTSRMSWEDYQKLTRPQKLALAFNADLVAARNKDLKSKKTREDYTPEQQGRYDQTVEKIFGKEGGSDTYAPNTVALLEQVDLKGVGQDLDEYLSLERAFTADMVKGMKKLSKDLPLQLESSDLSKETYAQVRTPTNTQLVNTSIIRNYRNKINEVMTQAETVRATVEDTLGVARNESLQAMGADVFTPGVQAGFPVLSPEATARIENNENYTQQEGETYMFQRSYEYLMNPANKNLDELWFNISYNDMNERDVAKMWDYFDKRSRQEERFGRPKALGTGGRTPKEIREFAGIGD